MILKFTGRVEKILTGSISASGIQKTVTQRKAFKYALILTIKISTTFQ